MNTIDMMIDIISEEIPEKYYGKTYHYFSFEVYSNEPVHLFLITANDDGTDEKIVITGLSEMCAPYADFVEFLKSITIDNSNPRHPLSFDLKMAREKYKVDIPVTVTRGD